jgi:hypothetical protein
MLSPKRSAKIRRRQSGASQTKRRAISRSSTLLPAQGRSETIRGYWLWTRLDARPQSGQARSSAAARADTNNTPSSSAVRSTINPAGIRDDKRSLLAMMLIPLRKQRHPIGELHHL